MQKSEMFYGIVANATKFCIFKIDRGSFPLFINSILDGLEETTTRPLSKPSPLALELGTPRLPSRD